MPEKKFSRVTARGNQRAVLPARNDILLRANRKNIRIMLDDILFAESARDYVKLILRDQSLIVKTSISSLLDKLPSEQFVRIHRSFIVCCKAVSGFEPETVRIGEYLLPVSRSYRHEAEKALKKN